MSASPNIAELVNRLLEALRHELQQYGELMALLEQQREHVMTRAADEVLHSVVAINEQSAKVQDARRQRESSQADVARALQKPEDPSFAALVPLLPEPYQFAVSALVKENNELLTRVQQRARQNHLLLTRSLELMQRFMNTLLPAAAPTVYSDTGNLQPAPPSSQALYEATG